MIEGFFELVRRELEEGSIYRGKAVDGQQMPNFLDLSAPIKAVYSENIQRDLEANIWAVLRYSEQHKALGLPLKRAILLLGAYGTGKSLAGFLTAKEAIAHSWTFIMARPGRDDFLQVMQTARLYQPAVVFFEDAETMTGTEQSDTISQVLDVFDGITAKGTNLMVVMTTNHPESIHKGMHRPGRVDAQIEIGPLDAEGIEKLIRITVRENMLAGDTDFTGVVAACEGYVPAFVKEVADRAIRYALSRAGGRMDYTINGDDLIAAAEGLRAQYGRMVGAGETPSEEKSMREFMEDAARKGVASLAADHEQAYSEVWDPKELAKAQNGNS